MPYAFGNAQHIGLREQQQDSFGFSDPANEALCAHGGFLAVVADGMGGMQHGDLASRSAVRAFLQAYERKAVDEPIPDALWRCLHEAAAYVRSAQTSLAAGEEIGTTFVAAALHHQHLYWISVGDSGLFLYREGEWTQLNTPHIYARELDARAEAGEITAEQALSDPQREALTSFLGGEMNEVDRNVRAFPLHASDCLLLASDGLFRTLAPDEMSSAMVGTLQERCEALVRRTLEKRSPAQDNVTAVALALEETALGVAASALPKTPPRRAIRRRAGIRVAVFAAALAAMAAGYFWRTYCCQPPPAPLAKEKPGQGYDPAALPPSEKAQEDK
ncbi:MAG: serine/threonine-protein phosphatase [Bryobacterales bacterium]|nr:serine/threonine-protein phosphatase [Bryobacterales bacterium]